ncbi:MAG: zincin-like metallopeptidase domain-containing protein [Chitinophagales bacterium]|nr:zincin-like metallopeptidase domain-containing protein [Chitinophagales bacterium]
MADYPKKKDFYQDVTKQMIQLLEAGTAPWRCGWSRYGFARNYVTNHRYRGINAILMNLTPHPIPYFVSFKQAKELGATIRKGAKASRAYFFKCYYKDQYGNNISAEEATALHGRGEETQRIAFLKYYNLFNIADLEGIEITIPHVTLKDHEKITRCEQFIKQITDKPQIIHENADTAFYHPLTDQLNIPALQQFNQAEEYYSTLFHELTHSTGHETRLHREGVTTLTPFGSPDYSKEELIAEMGASFLCAHTGINVPEITTNSAAYLQGWLTVLKADHTLIFKAAAKAQKAVDYLLGISPE